MKSAVRRKQHQDALRKRILDAARELFVAEGVEAVSMRKIADKIGYSATTLYNHFDDKEALLRALCDADFGALEEAFQKIGKIADPIERMRRLGQCYIEFALKHPNQYRFMFMTPRVHGHDEEPCEEAPADSADTNAYTFLRMTINEALAAGAFRAEYHDADLVSHIVWSAVHGVAALHLIMAHDESKVAWPPAEQIARASIEVLIGGLARAGAAPAASDKGKSA
jgi:AcrR family transcriptional regulator